MGLQDIVLAVDRQFIKASAVSDGSFPAWHGDVLHRETVELEDARRVVVQLLAVLEIGILNDQDLMLLNSFFEVWHFEIAVFSLIENILIIFSRYAP